MVVGDSEHSLKNAPLLLPEFGLWKLRSLLEIEGKREKLFIVRCLILSLFIFLIDDALVKLQIFVKIINDLVVASRWQGLL